jgi:hypothetical protein
MDADDREFAGEALLESPQLRDVMMTVYSAKRPKLQNIDTVWHDAKRLTAGVYP